MTGEWEGEEGLKRGWGGGLLVILQSGADVGCVICGGGMDADSSGVWAMRRNCMQMDLNLCLSTSSLAAPYVSVAQAEGQRKPGVNSY